MSLSDLLNSNTSIETAGHAIERARAYIRVSHERSAEKNISPETQRKRLEAYARERGYEIHEWYDDLALSAFKNDDLRVGWQRLIADAKADPLTSVILVWRYDRFSRGDNAQTIQRDLLKHGVRIESAEEGYYDPDSETGAIMMPLTWSLNRLFSIKLRNVVIPNMKTNFEQRDPETGWAYKNGGWAQFGYKKRRIKIGRNHKSMDIYKVVWLLDDTVVAGKPVWQWARTMLLEWRLKERLGYDSIAARLTQAGVPTPSGRSVWSNTTIQSLLGEWTRLYQYAGYAFWGREDCTDRTNRKQRDPSEWLVVPNAHPAIITEEECDAIYAMVADKKRTKTNKRGEVSSYALSGGLLKCKCCGANYTSTAKNGKRYYICGSHLYRRGAGCGPSWRIPQEDIEGLILSKILARIPEDRGQLQIWVDEINTAVNAQWKVYQSTAKDRTKEIKRLEKQMVDLLDLVCSVGSSEDLKNRIADTSAALKRLQNLDGIKKPTAVDAELLIKFREEVAEAARFTNSPHRSAILKEMVVEIWADSEKKKLSGTLLDPRSDGVRYLAVPRGVGVSHPIQSVFQFEAAYNRKRGHGFRAA